MEWYMMVWQRYAEFEGRSRRREYWTFALVNVIICVVLEVIGMTFFTSTRSSGIGMVVFGLLGLYGLAALIPGLAVSVRRLHDIGMSGWLWLISLVPFLGGVVLLVMFLMDSKPETNQYGPNPKAGQQLPASS